MHDKIGVLIFCYKRVDSLNNLLSDIDLALSTYPSDRLEFYFFIDGLKITDSNKKRNLLFDKVDAFSIKYSSKIFKRDSNLGLSKNIKKGIDYVVNYNKKFISLEDDLRLSINFFEFMIKSLDFYANNLSIGSVSGTNYFNKRFSNNLIVSSYSDCLAWGSWKNRWINQNNNINSLLDLIKDKKYKFNRSNCYPFYRLLRKQKHNKTSWAIVWYANNFLLKRSMIFSSICLAAHHVYETGTNYSTKQKVDPLDNIIENDIPICVNTPIENLINCDNDLDDFYKKYDIGFLKRTLLKYGKYN